MNSTLSLAFLSMGMHGVLSSGQLFAGLCCDDEEHLLSNIILAINQEVRGMGPKKYFIINSAVSDLRASCFS